MIVLLFSLLTTLALAFLGVYKYVIPDFVSPVRMILRILEVSYDQLEMMAKCYIGFNISSSFWQLLR